MNETPCKNYLQIFDCYLQTMNKSTRGFSLGIDLDEWANGNIVPVFCTDQARHPIYLSEMTSTSLLFKSCELLLSDESMVKLKEYLNTTSYRKTQFTILGVFLYPPTAIALKSEYYELNLAFEWNHQIPRVGLSNTQEFIFNYLEAVKKTLSFVVIMK